MRTKVALFILTVLILSFIRIDTTQLPRVSAQSQSATCDDSTIMNALLDSVLSGTDKFQALSPTSTADDFAAIIDASIVARQTIADTKIDPSGPCFLAKIAAEQVMNDVTDYATYALFAKLNLKNADQYQKNLDTIRTRVQTDMQTFGQFHGSDQPATVAP